MAMFDELVLNIPLWDLSETSHALLYLYELAFIPSGVSIHTLSAEDTLEESIFCWLQF